LTFQRRFNKAERVPPIRMARTSIQSFVGEFLTLVQRGLSVTEPFDMLSIL